MILVWDDDDDEASQTDDCHNINTNFLYRQIMFLSWLTVCCMLWHRKIGAVSEIAHSDRCRPHLGHQQFARSLLRCDNDSICKCNGISAHRTHCARPALNISYTFYSRRLPWLGKNLVEKRVWKSFVLLLKDYQVQKNHPMLLYHCIQVLPVL